MFSFTPPVQSYNINFWLLLSLTQQEYPEFPFSAKASRVSSWLQCEVMSRLSPQKVFPNL